MSLFSGLFGPRRRKSPAAADKDKASRDQTSNPRIPDGNLVWAVGDIHGRLDLLDPLIERILEDIGRSFPPRRSLVFLGDHIDRGPESRGVLERLAALRRKAWINPIFLRGNHEEALESFLQYPDVGPRWCDHGGRETLRSFGVPAPSGRDDEDGWAEASKAMGKALGADCRALLADQVHSFEIGDYFFAHAGARPGVPLSEQSPNDLMWIREPFLRHPEPFERKIVHGHTPEARVHADHRRIGLDTGAYATGVLTALRLEGLSAELLQTGVEGGRVRLERSALA